MFKIIHLRGMKYCRCMRVKNMLFLTTYRKYFHTIMFVKLALEPGTSAHGEIPQGQSHEGAGLPWNLSDMNLTESLWAINRSKFTEALIQIWYHDEEIGGLGAKLYERIAKV